MKKICLIFMAFFMMVSPCFGAAGDVDGFDGVDLKDAVMALQVAAGMSPAGVQKNADVNDSRIGIEEAVYVLRDLADISPGRLVLKAEPANLMADGTSISTITATVKDTDGNLVEDGLHINFTIEEGDGKFLPSLLTAAVTTTVSGKVSVQYQSPIEVGTVIIRAEREDKKSAATIKLSLTAGVASISLVPAASEIRVDGGSTSITATVTDSNGEPVAAGTEFVFETNHGVFSNDLKKFTVKTPNDQGTFTLAFMSEGKAAKAAITCTVGGVSQVAT